MTGHTIPAAMAAALAVLLCALLTGLPVTRICRVTRFLPARLATSALVGSAVLSSAVFLFGATVGVTKLSCAAVMILCAGGAQVLRFRRVPAAMARTAADPVSRRAVICLGITASAFALLYLAVASFPEVSADGSDYHLGLLGRYIAAQRIERVSDSILAMLPQGFEMLYLPALLFGGGSACAMFHVLYLTLALPLFAGLAEVVDVSRMACFAAAVFFYVTPMVGATATTAYVDSAAAVVCLGAVYFALAFVKCGETPCLALSGLLCSFAASIKYTDVPIVLVCLVVALRMPRKRQTSAWQAGTFLASCAAVAPFWMLRNWWWYRNPLAPFGNGIFVNPFVHQSFEGAFRAAMAHLNGLHLSPALLLETTVRGERSQGLVGPAYLLLVPAALFLAARQRYLWVLITAAMLAVYPGNLGARFLEPALPFAALAIMAAVSREAPPMLLPLVVLHAALSWPEVLAGYCDRSAWRIQLPAVQDILRRPSDEAWLAGRLAHYATIRALEKDVPPNAAVWSLVGIPRAYVRQAVHVAWESAADERLHDILARSLEAAPAAQRFSLTFTSAPQTRYLRLRPGRVGPRSKWAIDEIRISGEGGSPVRPARIRCYPNREDCLLVLDANPVTNWKNWQDLPAGAGIDLDLGQTVGVASIEALCPRESDAGLRVEFCAAPNQCSAASVTPDTKFERVPSALTECAREFLRVGIQYVIIDARTYALAEERIAASGAFQQVFAGDGLRILKLLG